MKTILEILEYHFPDHAEINPKELKEIASIHLSKTIDENIEVLKQFKEIDLEKTTLIETKKDGKLLYLMVGDFFKEARQLKCVVKA